MSFLDVAEEILGKQVKPLAQAMDHDVEVMRQGLQMLEDGRLLSLKRPMEFGGPEVNEQDFRSFQESVARYSGALAFLQTQHQSAVSMLSKSDNQELKASVLPNAHLISGTIAIGFSQLRREGPPVMRAIPVDGGYVLDGHVPWATGAGFFPRLLVGATLPDGEAVFALTPFHDIEDRIKVSEPMRLAAMQAAQTVTVDFHEFFVPDRDIAFVHPAGWIQRNDMINVTLQGYFALGCAQAGIDIVRAAGERRNTTFLLEAATALAQELEQCRLGLALTDAPLQARLDNRAWAIDLAARCAHAGVVASSGAANSANHPAQRVYREALVFSVSAQTGPIMEASLARLVGRGQTALR